MCKKIGGNVYSIVLFLSGYKYAEAYEILKLYDEHFNYFKS